MTFWAPALYWLFFAAFVTLPMLFVWWIWL